MIERGVGAECAATLLDALSTRVEQVVALTRADLSRTSDVDRAAGASEIDVIRACEAVVRIAQGLQHDAVSALEARRAGAEPSQEPQDPSAVLPRTRSLRAEVGMARGVGNGAGQHSLDVAIALRDHPMIHALLRDGAISAPVAAAVCAETAPLDRRARRRIDERVVTALPGMSAREASAVARHHVLALDAGGSADRADAARATRHIRLRRLSDAMAELTVRAPAEQVIAAWRRLHSDAFRQKASTDPRTTRQIAADQAIEALTGVDVDKPDGSSTHAPAEIGLLMRPETLFGGDDAPGVLDGYGPVPAALCRRLAGRDASWLRRVFTDDRGDPRDADERRRRFPARIARLIRTIDGQCLRPFCDCDATDIDHVDPHGAGGLTTVDNAQALCRHDNLVKEAPGWRVRASHGSPATDGRSPIPDTVTWTTPTGHHYAARRRHRIDQPWPHRVGRERGGSSPLETHLRGLISLHRPDRR